MAVTEAQKRAYTKYDKENTKMFGIKLNKNTDADLIAFLEGGNVQTKIKLALRECLSKSEGTWEDCENGWKCSCCGGENDLHPTPYCMWCGAEMK